MSNTHYLIRWKANLGYCVNIPGGVQNATLNFYPCNAGDSDQRFRITTVGGLPNYVSPVNNGFQGVLESQFGQRLTIPGNNATPGLAYPNNNDASQQIQFIQSGNGYLFQRLGTSFSLSSNTLNYTTANQAGMALTTYNTGGGRWQNFGFVNQNNGWYSVVWQSNPAYCLSAGTNSGSNVGVIVPCNSGDARQKWRPTGTSTTYQEVSSVYYYAALVSGLDERSSASTFAGHSWAGVFKLTKIDKRKFVNGVYDSSTYSYVTGSDKTTVSAYETLSVPALNADISYLDNLISGNRGSQTVYRILPITAAKYSDAISTYPSQTGCSSYPATYIGTVPGQCNCTQSALSYWKLVTNESVVVPATALIPNGLKNAIQNTQNGQSMTFVKP